ncbi:Uncharacterised protein [Chryseobacterium gleum]|jgi:hypothetical protein|uniref:Uncharacterized protein n=2 Tax=Chryseobacterium gleum TaxID=250 RepID=A0A3S4QYV5_CHRGE|nr:hypothetical protein [Chryseobacterium gleum]EFK35222.1 hypothetical protein HMPREF0204_14291 [Chryseobacterium gleum ATCC 35910]MCD9616323.1 hypothetical protein [Chryseobacterium gleum]QQY31014.1 hypothetical protein I6I60_19395 [Chryseobacterium gleum]VEE04618.1 Uncharacterised protein [Chryseobacterium gleum]
MDEIKTDRLDPVTDKHLIDEYFNLAVKKELNIDIDVSSEYIAAHNIVSKKSILVKTFSDAVMGNPDLYLLLRSLIQNVNTYSLTKSQIISTLKK